MSSSSAKSFDAPNMSELQHTEPMGLPLLNSLNRTREVLGDTAELTLRIEGNTVFKVIVRWGDGPESHAVSMGVDMVKHAADMHCHTHDKFERLLKSAKEIQMYQS